MASDGYRHIKVPLFGCTYPHDFSEEGGRSRFELCRLVRDEAIERVSDLPTIILSIEAGQGKVALKIGATRGKTYAVSHEGLLVIPKDAAWTARATTPTLKLLLLEMSPSLVEASVQEFDLDARLAESVAAEPRAVTRTTWINEIFHRYIFERSIAKRPDSLSARFLEAEIFKELYYAVSFARQEDHDVPFFADLPEPLRRALTYIEHKLHEPVTAAEMAAAAMTSESTLARLFRAHLNVSPIRYLWDRRLDEADRLLLTGRYSVSEVAALLGFGDGSSFSKSFYEHFGVRPSSRIPKS